MSAIIRSALSFSTPLAILILAIAVFSPTETSAQTGGWYTGYNSDAPSPELGEWKDAEDQGSTGALEALAVAICLANGNATCVVGGSTCPANYEIEDRSPIPPVFDLDLCIDFNSSPYDPKWFRATWAQTQDDSTCAPKVVDRAIKYNCIEPEKLFALEPQPEPPEPKMCVGNPCDPASGNKSQTEVDYASTAEGVPVMVRYYNSKGAYRTGTSMPAGWRHTYSRVLDEEPDRKPTVFFSAPANQSDFYYTASDACTSGWDDIKSDVWSGDLSTATASFTGGNTCTISSGGQTKAYFTVRSGGLWGSFTPPSTVKTITRPNGAAIRFEQSGSDWVAPLNSAASLEQSGSNWIFTDASGAEETYNASGQLISITRRNGQTETLEYDLTVAQGGDDDSSTLDKVTGPFGHTLSFAYDTNDQLISVTTPDGTITYGFDSDDNLASVTYPDTNARQYVYEDTDLPHHLTGIIDENSDRFATWAYDDAGRAVSSEHAGGKEDVDLVYNANGTTTITAANGASRTYTFGTERGRQVLTGISGDVCSTCVGGNIKSRTYDTNGFLDEATDWNNVITKTARNSDGLVTTLTEADGSLVERETTYTWHSTYRLPTQISRPNHDIDYTYDTDGNPTEIEVTNGTLSRTWTMTYNSDGQVLTINGPRTDVTDTTTFDYYTCTTGDECGQLESITNALSQVTDFDSYDDSGRLLQMTEPNGLETSFTYDDRGNVLTVKQTPAVGSAVTTTMTYDDAGQLATVTTPEGLVLTYSYSAAHYLESITDNLGNEVAYTYDSMGNLTDQNTYDPSDVLKHSLDYVYGLDNRIDSITNGSVETSLGTDLVGNLTTVTDGLDNETENEFDALNRLEEITDALSGVASFDYDEHDNVTSVVAANNASTSYVFDDLDNLTSETSADRGLTSYTYDAAGNRLTATDARSKTATYAYDALNRVTSISYPNTAENVTYGYDVAASNGIGRLTSISDQSGTTTYTYDEFGRIATDVRVISSVTYTTSYEYDDDGHIESITYPSGRDVDYTRNATGEITGITSTKSSTSKTIISSAAYEPFGPVSSLTYGNSVTFTYDHNSDYSVSDVDSSGIADKAYSYDAAGYLVSTDDGIDAAHDKDYGYDALGRLSSELWPNVETTTYNVGVLADNPVAYWRLSETSGTTAADSSGNGHDGTYTGTISYSQTSLAPGSDDAIRVATQGAGYVDGPTLTGTTVTGVEAWFQTDSTATHRDVVSLHNSNSDRVLVTHRINGTVAVWKGASSPGIVMTSDGVVSSSQPHHVAVWYESSTNKTYMMIDGVTQAGTYTGNVLATPNPKVRIGAYQYNSTIYKRYLGEIDEVAIYDTAVTASTFANHLAAPPYTFTYDANGNRTVFGDAGTTTAYGYQTASNRLTSIASSSLQRDLAGNRTADVGGTRTYTYTDSGRLKEVKDSSVTTASYVYNALGQRTKKTVGSTTTVYVFDLAGNLIAEHGSTGTLIRDYVWLDAVPVAQIDSGEAFRYLHVDHLSTPRLASNDSGTVIWRWDGDAFGTASPDEDPDQDSNGTTVNLRLPGQYFDAETGFHYNYYRTYDPSTGRYLESDPIGLSGGLNTYGYVYQNPLSYVDPLGLQTVAAGRAAAGAIVNGAGAAAACLLNPDLCPAIAEAVCEDIASAPSLQEVIFREVMMGALGIQSANQDTNIPNVALNEVKGTKEEIKRTKKDLERAIDEGEKKRLRAKLKKLQTKLKELLRRNRKSDNPHTDGRPPPGSRNR